MEMEFEGRVLIHDKTRDRLFKEPYITIGGEDIVKMLDHYDIEGKMLVGIAGELDWKSGHIFPDGDDHEFEGEPELQTGFSYSEHTPIQSDIFAVGEDDVLDLLASYGGQFIRVRVSFDEVQEDEEESP